MDSCFCCVFLLFYLYTNYFFFCSFLKFLASFTGLFFHPLRSTYPLLPILCWACPGKSALFVLREREREQCCRAFWNIYGPESRRDDCHDLKIVAISCVFRGVANVCVPPCSTDYVFCWQDFWSDLEMCVCERARAGGSVDWNEAAPVVFFSECSSERVTL